MSGGFDLSGFSMFELFKGDAESNLQVLNAGLLALEANPADLSAIEPLMRAAHSIKGAARIIGLDVAVKLAHAMEDCLVAVQKGREALVPGRIDQDAQGVATDIAARLDQIAEEYERGWQGRPTQDAGIRLSRTLRGVEENRTLDGQMLRSGESRRLGEMTQALQDIYAKPARLIRKDRDQPIHGPLGLLQAVFLEGEKGLSLQRYKGLGEMNPEQLWETTLDPVARTMLQVRIEDVAEAEDLFTKLMGDVVEPRREFIQQNALNVENLDT